MQIEVNNISKKEWDILLRRRSMYNFDFKVIETQKEEMLEDNISSTNNFASNAAPSEDHLINENKNKKDIVIKDVDTGIDSGKFRIMISYE